MHVIVSGNYNVTFLVQPGTDCSDWISEGLFEKTIRNIPELSGAELQVGISRDKIIVHNKNNEFPADKITVGINMEDDIQGRHDVEALRKRLFRVFTPIVNSLKENPGCIDAYLVHPDIKLTEVVKDHNENILEFRKRGTFAPLTPKQPAEQPVSSEGEANTQNKRQGFSFSRLFAKKS